MMVNIVKKMRQEFESGEQRSSGVGESTWSVSQSAESDSELVNEMNLVWDNVRHRGRLDIAGTKQIAR